MMSELRPTASAVIEGDFRYELRRYWGSGLFDDKARTCVWIMLNPSTADGTEDDATIRKITGYSKRWGFNCLVVVNLFAFRATQPSALIRASHERDVTGGPRADAFIVGAIDEADRVVCGWGNNVSKVVGGAQRATSVIRAIREHWKTPMALKLTKEGQPQHPLYLPGAMNAVPLPRAKHV